MNPTHLIFVQSSKADNSFLPSIVYAVERRYASANLHMVVVADIVIVEDAKKEVEKGLIGETPTSSFMRKGMESVFLNLHLRLKAKIGYMKYEKWKLKFAV